MNRLFLIIFSVLLVALLGCSSQQKAISDPFNLDNIPEVSHIDQIESTAQMIEASKQAILGNFDSAILLYAEAAKTDPRNSAALYELARLHARQGFLQDGEGFAKRAVNLDPGNKYYNMLLADIYFAQNKNEQGYMVQKRMASENQTDINIQISFMSSLIYLEKYEEAIAQIDFLERQAGFNNDMSLQKQRLYIQMEKPELALEEAKRLVSYFPNDPIYLELLAELYNENNQPEEAYKIYQQMREVDPENPMALLLLSDHYRNNGDDEKAFDHLSDAFYNSSLDINAKARIMGSYYFMSQEDTLYANQALELCTILLETHPEEARAYAIYGDFLSLDKDNLKAREMYMKAAQIDPSKIEYWQQALSMDASLMDYEHMLTTAEKALEYFFEQPVIFFFKGIALLQLDNFEQAIQSLEYGKELVVEQPELKGQFYTLLGDTYHKTGNVTKSYENYEEALKINPDDPYALNNYSYYMSERGENLQKALEMSQKSLELDPENASFQDTYGWIKYQMGDYQKAEFWIKKALDSSPEPGAVVLEHYGDVLYKQGRKDEAIYYWEKALEAQQNSADEEEGSEFLPRKVAEKTLVE